MNASSSFQSMLSSLKAFWALEGCAILEPYDLPMGAGTFHPDTFFRSLSESPSRVAYVQPSRRPKDGRYGENPNRMQRFYQFQVLLKPSPEDSRALYLRSLSEGLGIDLAAHDVRFVEDNWESPTLGATGLGYEVWLDGMEVSQFTYFQQVAGVALKSVSLELTYGLERLAMYLQGVDRVYDLVWARDKAGQPSLSYGDVHLSQEGQQSVYNFESSDADMLRTLFSLYESESGRLLTQKDRAGRPLYLPAYEQALMCSHVLNLLDARGAISTPERQALILRVRGMSRKAAEGFLEPPSN